MLRESAPYLRSERYRTDTANALDALAVVAHHRGDDRAAATALLVASAERSRQGVAPWPTVRPFIDGIHRWVRHSLGDDAFEQIGREATAEDVFDTFNATLAGLAGELQHRSPAS